MIEQYTQEYSRPFLGAQWLSPRTSKAGGKGSTLVGELRSHVLHGTAKKFFLKRHTYINTASFSTTTAAVLKTLTNCSNHFVFDPFPGSPAGVSLSSPLSFHLPSATLTSVREQKRGLDIHLLRSSHQPKFHQFCRSNGDFSL